MRKKPHGNAPAGRAHDEKVVEDFVAKCMAGLSRLECAVCGRINGFDFYMVRDETWREAGLKRDASCCLDCLSETLGRALTLRDFDLRNPVNRPVIFGYLVARRELESAKERGAVLARPPRLPALRHVPRRAKDGDAPARPARRIPGDDR